MANAVSAYENAVSSIRVPERNKISWVSILREGRPRCGCNCHCRAIVEKGTRAGRFEDDSSGLKLTVQDYAGGEFEARQAIDLDYRIPEAHLNLALILYQTSRTEEALAAQRRDCGG